MHFFNPPPLMQLLEVIAGDADRRRGAELARAAGEAMGKRVILAADGPGFLVNRCSRPFGAGGAAPAPGAACHAEQIDRICRLGGGFRMGPFELMDLVGIDVGFEVAKSFNELSFGEPRWRPSPIQARMVAAGPARPQDRPRLVRVRRRRRTGPTTRSRPSPAAAAGGSSSIVGDGALADGLRERARRAPAGTRASREAPTASVPALMVDCGADAEDDPPLQGGPQADPAAPTARWPRSTRRRRGRLPPAAAAGGRRAWSS